MNTGVGRRFRFIRTAWWCLVLFAVVLFGSLSVWALPTKGTPAPPLQFTQLLQAPAGASADWRALRGKVVVLEFWATWCENCVANLPDWNKLVAALDPAKFQFISVDDREDPKVVQSFLGKRKMAGWVGLDTTSKVVHQFGVKVLPTTIIVDGKGRIVATTSPENIKAADLLAVAAGKSVNFKPMTELNAEPLAGPASPAATVKPLYEVSLTKAAPNMKLVGAMSAGPGRMDIYGWTAEDLLTLAYNEIPRDRIVPVNPLPEGLFSLHAVWSSAEDNDSLMTSFLQPAIGLGLNLNVQSKTVTKKAYVLKATDASKKLLLPTTMTTGSWMNKYKDGKLQVINGSMDDLAKGLESGLDAPVVNETGIAGRFDEELEFPAKDGDAASAALTKTLGLELVKEDRPIAMLEVTNREDAKKAAKSAPEKTPQK